LSLTVKAPSVILLSHMDIRYLGHSSFKLSGSSAKVVTDPFDPAQVGLKYSKQECDIVTVSHEHGDHNKTDFMIGDPLIIDIPGEYERKGIRVTGFESFHDDKQGAERGKNILFKIEIDDVSILHCGDLGHMLTNEMIEEIGEVDVLLVPSGGFYTIAADEAATIVRAIEPHIVIPMHYGHPDMNPELAGKLAPLSTFLSAMGGQTVEPLNKLTVKKSELEEISSQVVVLEVSL